MKLKKIIGLALAGVLSISVVGCSSTKNKEDDKKIVVGCNLVPGEALLNIPKKISELPSQINSLREGTIEAIETIGTLSKMIINAIDWVSTILFNPIIVLTFIDKLTIVIIISLIVLKMLGFNNLEKWILLSILVKVVAMVFI